MGVLMQLDPADRRHHKTLAPPYQRAGGSGWWVEAVEGAALDFFFRAKAKTIFWFQVRKIKRSQKNVTKNNSCHPQNR